ncbi:MAG: hypothetical protein WA989_15165 [Henriciella sp.]|uniref:hypothetical protein n=1 Tax=Henriciella sp. TaxID=1968823 RepID=UPI003C761470
MRGKILILSLLVGASLPASAENESLIGQIGDNQTDTGERSNANLNQIGRRAVEAGKLVDQIDAAAANGADIDESSVSEALPSNMYADTCLLSPRQEALVDYLKAEGRVFGDSCEMLSWLDGGDGDDPSERDLFNVIFGPEAQRVKQAELDRREQEQAELEARARLLEAINSRPAGGR